MRLKDFTLYLLLLVSVAACDNNSGTNILDQALESGDPYFSILFNKSFARRFSLDENKAVVLSDNLKAIAIEINKINNRYTCELHLYIDDKLDIYKPQTGDYFSGKPMAESFFINDFSDKDNT